MEQVKRREFIKKAGIAGGAAAVAGSRDPDRARGALPEQVELRACDVRDRDALAALFEDCAPFDILISAATGGARASGPFLEMDMDGFQGSFDKLWGYTNVVRFGANHLADDGCIVLVSGTPARHPKPGQIAVGAVGAAVENFSRIVAREIAPKRLNVVSPGVIDTPMFGPESEMRQLRVRRATTRSLVAAGLRRWLRGFCLWSKTTSSRGPPSMLMVVGYSLSRDEILHRWRRCARVNLRCLSGEGRP